MSSRQPVQTSHRHPSGKLASILLTAVAAALALGTASTVVASGFVQDDISTQDTDGDWITERDEIMRYGTNPARPDTDGDGLHDGVEITMYGTDPLLADSDGDGILDGDEIRLGTDVLGSDTDSDDLRDGEEVALGSDPFNPDTDGDGLLDGVEIRDLGSSPVHLDSDGDGLLDADEVLVYGTNPARPDARQVFFAAPEGRKAQLPATAGASATTQTIHVAVAAKPMVVARIPLSTTPSAPVVLNIN